MIYTDKRDEKLGIKIRSFFSKPTLMNTKYGLKTIFGVFHAYFFSLQAAHQFQFYNNFQSVKTKFMLFLLMAWSLNCIELIFRKTANIR